MDKCQWCGKHSSAYGMVSLSLKNDELPQHLCGDCFNVYMANTLEIEDDRDFEEEVIFNDYDDVRHSFQIIKRIHSTGICWEAVEFLEGDTIGYLFQINQDYEENQKEAIDRLYKKVEKGLTKKFIEKKVFQGHRFNSLKNDVAEGRIEWDERYEGNTPKFIIDGEEYSLDELGRMIMSYEGWNFRLEIMEPTD